ncbi:MAG: hypothetical protein H6828_10375 [Planctomycetes bacterium]|nr:hypothetical protein [Planctomycetota bacterium]
MSLLALPLLLALHGGGPYRSPEDPVLPPPASVEDVTALELDALIERVPVVGREFVLDAEAGPGEVRRDRYAEELRRRLDEGLAPSVAQWRRLFVRTGVVHVPARWVAGVPFAVSLREATWLDGCELQLVPTWTGWRTAQVGICGTRMCGDGMQLEWQLERYQELGELPLGSHVLEFEVRLCSTLTADVGPRRSFATGRTRALGTMTFPVDVVATLDEALPPVTSAALEDAVRDSLRFIGEGRPHLRFEPDVARHPALAGVGLALEVELLRGDESLRTWRLDLDAQDWFALAAPGHADPWRVVGWKLPELPQEALDDPELGASYSLRVRGTDRDALRLWGAHARWSGELTLPVSAIPRADDASLGASTDGR